MREIEIARDAGRRVGRLCDLLQDASLPAWDIATKELSTALECVTALERSLKSSNERPAGLAAEIAAIRREIAKAQALLDSAGRFYQGLARLMQDQDTEPVSNYAPGGKAGPVLARVPAKVVVHG